jgi:RHS repeat-associated protein
VASSQNLRVYDAVGRKTSETNDTRAVTYQYDNAGNRTRTTWPDSYYVSYAYDLLNRMQVVRENSTTTNELAYYTYDTLSRRLSVCMGAWTSTTCQAGGGTNKATYSYETDSDLDLLTQVLNATTVTLDYGHNRSHQITSIAANDDFYLVKPATATSRAYVPNALNQYNSVAGNAATYDFNGNLLTWYPLDGSGKQTYTYDSENRLATAAVNGSGTAAISYDYDGLGRRSTKTISGSPNVVTSYLLDGDEEIAEYSGSTLLRRYITGPAIDDRIARAEGAGTVNPTKTYYHTNHQGSVVAITDAVGTASQRLSYDEYGNLTLGAVTTGEQFRYTGRRFDAETGLYYYRARYYTAQMGRFLQADPLGYTSNTNVYTYVSNDGISRVDPDGRQEVFIFSRGTPFIDPVLSAARNPSVAESVRQVIAESQRAAAEQASKPQEGIAKTPDGNRIPIPKPGETAQQFAQRQADFYKQEAAQKTPELRVPLPVPQGPPPEPIWVRLLKWAHTVLEHGPGAAHTPPPSTSQAGGDDQGDPGQQDGGSTPNPETAPNEQDPCVTDPNGCA